MLGSNVAGTNCPPTAAPAHPIPPRRASATCSIWVHAGADGRVRASESRYGGSQHTDFMLPACVDSRHCPIEIETAAGRARYVIFGRGGAVTGTIGEQIADSSNP